MTITPSSSSGTAVSPAYSKYASSTTSGRAAGQRRRGRRAGSRAGSRTSERARRRRPSRPASSAATRKSGYVGSGGTATTSPGPGERARAQQDEVVAARAEHDVLRLDARVRGDRLVDARVAAVRIRVDVGERRRDRAGTRARQRQRRHVAVEAHDLDRVETRAPRELLRRRRPLVRRGSSARAASPRDRLRVRGHALDRRELLDGRPHAREPGGGQPLHRDRLQERLEAEPADRARPAVRRQHVVAAGRVVAARHRRVVADEHRAGVADPAGERLRLAEQDDVLGRAPLDLGERALEIVAVDDLADRVRAVLGLRRELELGDARGRRRDRARRRPPTGLREGRSRRRATRSASPRSRTRCPDRRSCRRGRSSRCRTRAPRSPARRRPPTPRRCRAAPRRAATSPAPSGGVHDDDALDARHLRRHGAHDERRDERRAGRRCRPSGAAPSAARARRRARPRARMSAGRCSLVPAAHAVGEREHGALGQVVRRRRARGLDAVEAQRPLAQRLVAARAYVVDDLRDDAHPSIRSSGTSRIDDAPAASSAGSSCQTSCAGTTLCTATMPGSASGSTLGAREPGTSAQIASSDVLRRVQHQVARAAGVDDAAEDAGELQRVLARLGAARRARPRTRGGARPSAGRSCGACCRSRRGRRSRLQGRAAARARPSRARRRARSSRAAARARAAGSSSRRARRAGRRATAPSTRSGRRPRASTRRTRAAASSTTSAPRSRTMSRPVIPQSTTPSCTYSGHVVGAHEQRLDRRVPARERERAVAGRLGAEPGVVQQLDGRLAQPALRGDGDPQRARSAPPSQREPYPPSPFRSHCATRVTVVVDACARCATSRYGSPSSSSCATCQRCAIASSSELVQRSRRKRSTSSRFRSEAIARRDLGALSSANVGVLPSRMPSCYHVAQ